MFPELRHLYSPLQPAVNNTHSTVHYVEHRPARALQALVYCYWELKTPEPLAADFHYRVAADGCTDLFFEAAAPDEWMLSGFTPQATVFSTGRHFRYFGIRFFPAAFTLLAGVPAAALRNRCELLADVLPKLQHNLASAFERPNVHVADAADAVLTKYMASVKTTPDFRFYRALDLILDRGGNLSVEKEISTGISPRQLRRLFEHYIGDSPKTFSKVVRFQQFLHRSATRSSMRDNTLYFDAGYFDQAHFIREFKTFYGITPTQGLG